LSPSPSSTVSQKANFLPKQVLILACARLSHDTATPSLRPPPFFQVTIIRAANTLAPTTMEGRIPAVGFHRSNDNISLHFQRTKRQHTIAGRLTSYRRHNGNDRCSATRPHVNHDVHVECYEQKMFAICDVPLLLANLPKSSRARHGFVIR